MPGLEGRQKFVKHISDNRQRDQRPRRAGVFLARAEVLSGRERGDIEGMAPGQAWGWGSLQAAPGWAKDHHRLEWDAESGVRNQGCC